MLGCDHLKRSYNCGFSNLFANVFACLSTWEAEEETQRLQEQTKFTMNQDHKSRLSQSINSSTFLPVVDEHDYLTPLNVIENLNDWGTNIGFEVHPFNLLPVSMQQNFMVFHSSQKTVVPCLNS